MRLVSTFLMVSMLACLHAGSTLAQVEDDGIREYAERDLEAGGGLERPDLPDAPDLPGRPGLTVPDQVIDGPEAQEMILDILDAYDWILTNYRMPSGVATEQLKTIERARAQMLLAAPEELESFAQAMGPHVAAYRRAVRVQQSVLRDLQDQKGQPDFDLGTAKSAGFPSLRSDVPGYPSGNGSQDFSASEDELETEQDEVETEIEDREGASAPASNFFCDSTPSGGRASRRSAATMFEQRDFLLAADIIYEVANDICGGFSGGVSVFSAEYSCDICCIVSDVLHAISVWLYDQQVLCEDLIDSAETEAAYHNTLGIYDGISHVHDDLGAVGPTTIKGEIDQNEDRIITIDGKADVIIDQTACHPVLELRRSSGCNGNDDDCDDMVDECDEDVFGPTLHVDEAVGQPWYSSLAEAADAVMRGTLAEDACGDVTVSFDPLTGSCGAVTAVVSAMDSCGNTSTVTKIVKVDGTAPTVSIAGAVDGSCHPSIADAEAAVLAAATITDDCDANLDVRVDSTVTECALRVRIEAIDAAGHRSVDAVTVRVDDGAPGLDIDALQLGLPAPCFASIGEAEAAVAAIVNVGDNCSGAGDLPVSISSAGDPCSLVVTADTVDECGAAASDSIVLRVDPTPPVVFCSTAITEIDSSNHEMVNVGFSFSATDDCPGDPQVRIRVTSDEATASADGAGGSTHSPDAQVLRDLAGNVVGVALRAERSSSGNGRVYQITVEATDPCGNTASSACQVSVPPNGSGSPAVDDGQFYDATAVN